MRGRNGSGLILHAPWDNNRLGTLHANAITPLLSSRARWHGCKGASSPKEVACFEGAVAMGMPMDIETILGPHAPEIVKEIGTR